MVHIVPESLLSTVMIIRLFLSVYLHIQAIYYNHSMWLYFSLTKQYHTEAIEAATRTGCTDFDKVEFLTAINSI